MTSDQRSRRQYWDTYRRTDGRAAGYHLYVRYYFFLQRVVELLKHNEKMCVLWLPGLAPRLYILGWCLY
jgi:hypothetical protein